MVNSIALKRQLKSLGADSEVVYQGVDLDFWRDKNLRGNKIRIGCLYNAKPTKRWEDFQKLASTLGTKNYEYVGIGDTARDDEFLINFFANATKEELINIYSACHVWFAPTELEGLHNVPLEAALCGCLIIANDSPLSGMVDYAFDNETAMVYKSRDIEQAANFIRNPNWNVVENMQKYIQTHIGDRKTNAKKMVELLEKSNEIIQA